MTELYGIYLQSGTKPTDFLERVVPLVLPDARFDSLPERNEHAIYWKAESAVLDEQFLKLGENMGKEGISEFLRTKEFSRKVADMLYFLKDKLFPRDFECMEKEGFRDILELIKKRS